MLLNSSNVSSSFSRTYNIKNAEKEFLGMPLYFIIVSPDSFKYVNSFLSEGILIISQEGSSTSSFTINSNEKLSCL